MMSQAKPMRAQRKVTTRTNMNLIKRKRVLQLMKKVVTMTTGTSAKNRKKLKRFRVMIVMVSRTEIEGDGKECGETIQQTF